MIPAAIRTAWRRPRSAQEFPTIHVSAGRRGLEIELAPENLRRVLDGEYTVLCR